VVIAIEAPQASCVYVGNPKFKYGEKCTSLLGFMAGILLNEEHGESDTIMNRENKVKLPLYP